MNKEYHEIQTLRNWFLWLILVGLLLFFVFASLSQIMLGITIGNNGLPNWALLTGVLFTALLVVILARTQLILDCNSQGFKMSFGPLGFEEKSWKEIKTAKVIPMPRVSYGRRHHSKYGTIYNAGAKHGLWLNFRDGGNILISTRQNEELSQFLKAIKKGKR